MESYSSTTQTWLSWFMKGILIIGFLFLVGRLIELQVIKGDYFRSLSENNRIKRVVIPAPRGLILARGGEILVGNRGYIRDYPLGEAFGHVSGYLGEVGPGEVGKADPVCFEKGARRLGSLVGRGGLEEQYNCFLSGVDGEEVIEVDTLGRMVRILGRKDPVPGGDIKTNIDYKLQIKSAQAMKEKKGAVIISDPKGEILTLYSSPSFNPALFLPGGDKDAISKILNDKNLPLFDRAIGGLYHPGSVFKPLVAIAALEDGKIDKNFRYEDPGVLSVKTLYGDFSYSNWYYSQYGKTEGEIGIVRAIARSTDTFFYKLGEMVGIEKLTEWMGNFGLNGRTGIDLPGEVKNLIPSPEWKLKEKGEKWFLGNTYHLSIGQGDLVLTPLSLSRIPSVVASGGKLCTPRIVNEAPAGSRPGYLLPMLRREQNPSEAPLGGAKGDKESFVNKDCKDLKIKKE
ncbi:hypothetical protein KJ695_05265, partial [Patescibacteria group bacterium]|nr:hypothetical protein [Patescibacteria group bacterium]